MDHSFPCSVSISSANTSHHLQFPHWTALPCR
uniref:Uncharacterized protein n=1 Tax=Setaria italica TaxID=4555 RepID=K3Y4K9_SETIT